MGRLVSETYLSGKKMQYQYDPLGRLIKVIQFKNKQPLITTFAYDEAGNRISQVDASGRMTSWIFDALGRVLSRTLPLLMTETFVYENKTGHLIRHTDFNQQTTTYQYDLQNSNLLSVSDSDGRSTSLTM